MFNRFTERARKAVAYAKEEAQRLKHDHIGTEHLLFGLMREGEGVAAAVLQQFGLDVQAIRQEVERRMQPGSNNQNLAEIPFSPLAKIALENAAQESRALEHHHIGTEHLLLGLSRVGEGVAHKVLLSFHIDFNKLRTGIIVLLRSGKPNVLASEVILLSTIEKQKEVIEELTKRIGELEIRVKNLENL